MHSSFHSESIKIVKITGRSIITDTRNVGLFYCMPACIISNESQYDPQPVSRMKMGLASHGVNADRGTHKGHD